MPIFGKLFPSWITRLLLLLLCSSLFPVPCSCASISHLSVNGCMHDVAHHCVGGPGSMRNAQYGEPRKTVQQMAASKQTKLSPRFVVATKHFNALFHTNGRLPLARSKNPDQDADSTFECCSTPSTVYCQADRLKRDFGLACHICISKWLTFDDNLPLFKGIQMCVGEGRD